MLHQLALVAEALGEVVPVEVRPRSGPELFVDERRDRGNRVGAELADESNGSWESPGPVGQVARLARTPSEPEVAVGSVELREVGQRHRSVR